MNLVQQTNTYASSSTTSNITLNSVVAGNTIIIIPGTNSDQAFSSLTDSAIGNTISTAVTYGGAGSSTTGTGIYYVSGATAGAHTFTITVGTSANIQLYAAEYSGLGALDAASVVADAASGTAISTAPITTTQNGDLVVFSTVQGGVGVTFGSYTNGFTQIASRNTTGPSSAWASVTQATAGAISGGTTSSSGTFGWSAAIAAFKPMTGAVPTVTTVNSSASIVEGATNVAVVGTNFASGMTSAITQPGSVSVAQPFTFTNATSGTFNLTMEPGTGNQLAFTDATYTTNFLVTVGTNSSTPVSVTLIPPTGNIFETLASINGTTGYRFTATGTGDLVAGDQLEASGNATGTSAIPTGLTLYSDGTWGFTSGNTPANFYVRAYDTVAKVWGAWAIQTIAGAINAGGWRNLKVYELTSITGLVPWVSYIPIQLPAGILTTEYDRVDPNGAVTCTVLTSVTGLVPWVDYIPVYVVSSGTPWRFDTTGYIPMVKLA